ncbi:hypothetical protein F3I16_20980 [Pseudomonas sp. L-22-4S-12]|uniref:hypothetical protein n=1 Tax=Pseudomonas sp. L-22-4S-12 TaxID=2610893 RepID=UPI0013234F0F|nr:hypothetical protein [Pseudomonas sp. L-22-4S-12]MWV18514.1 hypothetical protein [Pseudomonas sp. L-22-4S-12]
MLFLFWAGSIAAFQLIIFKLKYQRGFYIKCLAVTFVSVIASPFVTGGLYKIANIIQKGKPDFEGDLARETSVCKISKIDKERRMGGTTYYIEADLSCTSIPNQKSVVWWYSYNDKKGKWSRTPTKNLPK